MHAVWRAVSVALGPMLAIPCLRAQTAELPPIFAPREPEKAPAPVVYQRPTLLSERMRSLINAAAMKAMADGKMFEGPVVAADGDAPVFSTSGGVMMMRPMVVRGLTLRPKDVTRPDVELLHFTPFGGDDHRRIAGGATMPLYHAYVGSKELQVDFTVLNGAGKGVDHNRDFTRGEISFTLKW